MSMKDGILKLHGREYKTVALRVHEFREKYPISEGWNIDSKIIHIDGESVLIRSAVVDPQGREVGVGFAEEKRTNRGVNSTSALENCQTSAIGRALACVGFGGSEFASADELANAIGQQNAPRAREQPIPQPSKRTHKIGSVSWVYAALCAEPLAIPQQSVDRYVRARGWDHLEGWPPENRTGFVREVALGSHPDLYQPEQAGGEG